MIKNIFLDFDGVIVDSNKIKTLSFLHIYKDYDKLILKKIQNHHEENGGMTRFKKFKYYHENFLNVKISKKEINKLSLKFTNFVYQKIVEKKLMPGFTKFINNNKQRYNLYVISATPQIEIRKICNEKNISNLFIDIYGSPKEKQKIINKIIFKNKYIKNQCLYIGDSYNDLVAAKISRINFLGFGKYFYKNKKDTVNSILRFNELENILKQYEN